MTSVLTQMTSVGFSGGADAFVVLLMCCGAAADDLGAACDKSSVAVDYAAAAANVFELQTTTMVLVLLHMLVYPTDGDIGAADVFGAVAKML